jgi:polysaccharide deacetylase 2 family uncharacterized protein YibQ
MTKKTIKKPRKKTNKKRRKKKQSSKILTKLNLFLSILLITLIAVGYWYFKYDEEKPTHNKTNTIDKDKQYNQYIKNKMSEYITDGNQHFEEYTQEFEKEYIHTKNKIKDLNNKSDQILEEKLAKIKKEILDSLKNEDKQVQDAAKDIIKKIDKEILPKLIENKKEKLKPKIVTKPNSKPKLAIIIDDVSYKRQVDTILNFGYDVNMSFLPPIPRHKNSSKIAQKLDQYMVHLPLQASSFKFEEDNTLHINDSLEKIDNTIEKIRKLYPKAIYINNHTGSKFTSNEKAMDRLMRILKKYNFKFIDSRTTSKTVGAKYAKKYGIEYHARNIFLDNKQEYAYIQNQLKKAIKIAKKTGHAIAIGHPHKMTMKVLKNSKPLFKGVDVVFVEQL